MTNRSAAIRHVRYTRRSRERHATADERPARAYPERVQTQTLPQATGQEALPLAGFYRLYESQLRAERKSAKTIRIYFDGLGKFRDWLEASYALVMGKGRKGAARSHSASRPSPCCAGTRGVAGR